MKNASKVETFTIQFEDITSSSLNVALSWENTVVKFPIEVEVDQKVDDQIAELMKNPDQTNAFVYFRAAEYYFHNSKSLDQAIEWIKTGLEKSPKNFRFGLLHAKILNATGDKAKALEIIKEANMWAKEAENNNYIGQTQLFMDQINN